MLKEIEKYRKLITEAATIAVREVFGTHYVLELRNINFTISYSDKKDSYEVALIDIEGTWGIENTDDIWKNIDLTLYNIEEYNLEDPQFLRGVFFGKFQALDDLSNRG